MIIKYILIILFLASPCFADTEYIYPSSDNGGWDAGTYDSINDPAASPNDSDLIYETTKSISITGTMTDLATADANDTYNYIIIHGRSQLTGTPGNETVDFVVAQGAESSTLTSGSNASWTTDNSVQITTHNSYAEINALAYTITSKASGAESVDQWQVSQFYVEVNYTPVTTARRIISTQ